MHDGRAGHVPEKEEIQNHVGLAAFLRGSGKEVLGKALDSIGFMTARRLPIEEIRTDTQQRCTNMPEHVQAMLWDRVRVKLEELYAEFEAKRSHVLANLTEHLNNMEVVAEGLANFQADLLRGEMDSVAAQG